MPFHSTLDKRLSQSTPFRRDAREARYLATYKLFLKFFKENIAVPNLTLGNAKIGVVLVYTWMQPAEINPDCWKHFALAKQTLRRDKAGRLTAHEIEALKCFVGGSLMATSKFLHFVNPSRYAIWDANIARAAYRYSWQQCNRADRYIQYLDDLRGLSLDVALRRRIRDAIGSPSDLRIKEYALSQLGATESTSKSVDSGLNIADFPFAPEKFTFDLSDDDGVDCKR